METKKCTSSGPLPLWLGLFFTGKWPEPQIGPSRTEPDGRLIPVTEAEQCEVFLQAIGNDHPLMELILEYTSITTPNQGS